MRRARLALLFMILAWFTVSNSGCLWLAIPSLAYSGYEAIEEKDHGTTSAQEASEARTKPASSTRQNDTSIE